MISGDVLARAVGMGFFITHPTESYRKEIRFYRNFNVLEQTSAFLWDGWKCDCLVGFCRQVQQNVNNKSVFIASIQ